MSGNRERNDFPYCDCERSRGMVKYRYWHLMANQGASLGWLSSPENVKHENTTRKDGMVFAEIMLRKDYERFEDFWVVVKRVMCSACRKKITHPNLLKFKNYIKRHWSKRVKILP